MWRCPKHVATVLNICSMSSCGCVLQETRSILQKLFFEQDRSEKQTMFYICFRHSFQFEDTIMYSRKGPGCVLADHLTRDVGFHRFDNY